MPSCPRLLAVLATAAALAPLTACGSSEAEPTVDGGPGGVDAREIRTIDASLTDGPGDDDDVDARVDAQPCTPGFQVTSSFVADYAGEGATPLAAILDRQNALTLTIGDHRVEHEIIDDRDDGPVARTGLRSRDLAITFSGEDAALLQQEVAPGVITGALQGNFATGTGWVVQYSANGDVTLFTAGPGTSLSDVVVVLVGCTGADVELDGDGNPVAGPLELTGCVLSLLDNRGPDGASQGSVTGTDATLSITPVTCE